MSVDKVLVINTLVLLYLVDKTISLSTINKVSYPACVCNSVDEWKYETSSRILKLGFLVDSEIVLSTRYGKTRVFINKTLSTETAYQQDLINRDLLSTRLIVGKVGPGMWCGNCNSTSD